MDLWEAFSRYNAIDIYTVTYNIITLYGLYVHHIAFVYCYSVVRLKVNLSRHNIALYKSGVRQTTGAKTFSTRFSANNNITSAALHLPRP